MFLKITAFVVALGEFSGNVTPAKDVSLSETDNVEIWNYTKVELLTIKESTIWDIAVSPHTGNIYIAQARDFWLLVKKGESTATKINSTEIHIHAVSVDYCLVKVYLGGPKGLKIYYESNGFVETVEVESSIWKLFVSRSCDGLYVRQHKDLKVYLYKDMFMVKVKLNIEIKYVATNEFVVDWVGNYYYTTVENGSGLTKIQLKGHKSTTYEHPPLAALAVDNLGRVFGCLDRRVYRLRPDASKPQLVAELDFTPVCISFDQTNNPVFGTKDNKVVVLKSNDKCSSLTLDVLDIVHRNMSTELENLIQSKFNELSRQNINMYNDLMAHIQSIIQNTLKKKHI